LLGAAMTAFSQGVAYFHAGIELLRSKSLDRNSYDSGDWFNRLDWTYADNAFGSGLPPESDNGSSWPVFRPLLADAALKPAPADIAWMRDAFNDLLRIRADSTLFRLRSAEQVQRRLRFFNTGPRQEPTVVAAHLVGAGLDGARWRDVVLLVNVDKQPHAVADAALAGLGFVLHPVLASPRAADRRAREARYDAAVGRFTVPPRTAVVFVRR
jgi:pullulanase/glycogen debranching enzyme